jgi:hypothetical protein
MLLIRSTYEAYFLDFNTYPTDQIWAAAPAGWEAMKAYNIPAAGVARTDSRQNVARRAGSQGPHQTLCLFW